MGHTDVWMTIAELIQIAMTNHDTAFLLQGYGCSANFPPLVNLLARLPDE
jgi:hypothetical protein